MITTGQSLTNRSPGRRWCSARPSAETNGESVVVEAFVEPDGAVAAAHVHPAQEERFEVLAGELEFRLGKKTIVAEGRATGSWSRRGRRTSSGTSARRPRTSSARSARRSASSS